MKRLLVAASSRLFIGRLPGMVAVHGDGINFELIARDPTYSHVFIRGSHEPHETYLTRVLLRPGDFAIDVGANHGWFALNMAAAVSPKGWVWAFEPLSGSRTVIERQLQRNPQLNVRVLKEGLGDTAGTGTIHTFAGLPHGHASMSSLGRPDYEIHRVPVTTLDLALSDADAKPVFIKIDVEGAELPVLLGARSTLAAAPAPILLLEVNYETSAAFGHKPQALYTFLKGIEEARYEVWRVFGGKMTIEENPALAPHGASWLCIPAFWENRFAKVIKA